MDEFFTPEYLEATKKLNLEMTDQDADQLIVASYQAECLIRILRNIYSYHREIGKSPAMAFIAMSEMYLQATNGIV